MNSVLDMASGHPKLMLSNQSLVLEKERAGLETQIENLPICTQQMTP